MGTYFGTTDQVLVFKETKMCINIVELLILSINQPRIKIFWQHFGVLCVCEDPYMDMWGTSVCLYLFNKNVLIVFLESNSYIQIIWLQN